MRRLALPVRALSLLVTASALLGATAAHADGSYPDPRQILLPAERPEQIILATNFGLIFSEDGGSSWLFSCEQALSAYAGPYLLGAQPQSRLFAVTSGAGLIYSDDDSCSWRAAGGTLTEVVPYAATLDPSNANRVYAIGVPRQDLRGGESLYASDDGGLTFGEPLFTAETGSALLNVLVAPGQPSTLFATVFSTPENHPLLLRSQDSGQHWDVVADLAEQLGNNPFELLAIDPRDDRRLYARVLGPAAESLATSDDGGLSFVQSVSIPGKLNAFLELASGTILVGGVAGTEAVGYRSEDGGHSYEAWPTAPHVHALAERQGKLYVAANNFADGYAIAVSDDEGQHFTPLAGFADVQGVKGCARDVCAKSCAYYADINLWPQPVCGTQGRPAVASNPGAAGSAPDAKADDECKDDGPRREPVSNGTTSGADDLSGGPGLRGSGGCACGLVGSRLAGAGTGIMLWAPLLWGLWRRRRAGY